jgi:ketosteroid isomerase-like protein
MVAGPGSITMMILFNGNEVEFQWHPIWRQPRRPMNFLGKVRFQFFWKTWSMSPVPGYSLALTTIAFGGIFNGRQEIAAFFGRVTQNSEFIEVASREMIEQGETVVVIGTASVRIKTTEKIIMEDWVHILKYNQGRIVFVQEYMDAAPVLEMRWWGPLGITA